MQNKLGYVEPPSKYTLRKTASQVLLEMNTEQAGHKCTRMTLVLSLDTFRDIAIHHAPLAGTENHKHNDARLFSQELRNDTFFLTC